MARAIWSGAVSFGLVNVPVRLYSATESKDVRFHEFQQGTGRRIRHERVAEGTDQEVPYEDVVKGYEYADGQYVTLTQEELEAAQPERTRGIAIEDFVELADVDPIFFQKTYYLDPGPGAEKPYALLLRAMEETGRVGIARFVFRTKEHLAAIRPMDGLLVLETMFFADEVRDVGDIDGVPAQADLDQREVDMA
ncbi:MAG TPA: Ku protein, partial [Actinomycetota bacterium]|nr:Ku protein [Actinomycetota bacterium]